MVIVVSAVALLSSKVIRKTPAAFSAAVFVRYVSSEPIARFRITRCPLGIVTRHLKTQTFLPLEETSKLTPPR